MKFKKGDKVKFLNDVGGGTVTEIIDKNTVKVLNDTGFEIPVLTEELMPDYSLTEYEKNDTISEKKIPETKEESVYYSDSDETNVYIAIVPAEKTRNETTGINIYLINDGNYFLNYSFITKGEKKHKSLNGILEPNIKENIKNAEIDMLPDNFEITIQLLFFDKKEFDVIKPVHKEIKIRTTKLLRNGTYKNNDFFDEPALIIPVFESNKLIQTIENLEKTVLNKVINQKEIQNKKLNKPKQFKKKEPKNIKEVDLHIHELLDDDTGLSDFDKLQYQMEIFNKEMKSAIKEGYRRIVFIHGVGSGSLKLKIRSELQNKYKQYKFQDASFREYGYGATMVLLRN